jgi:hypothetical protein
MVIDPSQDPTQPQEMQALMYYTLGHIDHRHCLVYTAEEARKFLLRTGHYGPWEGPEGTGDVAGLTRILVPVDHCQEFMEYMKRQET